MSDLQIRVVTVEELEQAEGLAELLDEYAAESAIHDIGPASPQFATYRAMEASGMFQAFGAFSEGRLVGFLLLLLPTLPHFGKMVGVTESFFVGLSYRKTGAGNALRLTAEGTARAVGAAGILMSAPTGGRLAHLLPHVGYRETNTTYFKALQ